MRKHTATLAPVDVFENWRGTDWQHREMSCSCTGCTCDARTCAGCSAAARTCGARRWWWWQRARRTRPASMFAPRMGLRRSCRGCTCVVRTCAGCSASSHTCAARPQSRRRRARHALGLQAQQRNAWVGHAPERFACALSARHSAAAPRAQLHHAHAVLIAVRTAHWQ